MQHRLVVSVSLPPVRFLLLLLLTQVSISISLIASKRIALAPYRSTRPSENSIMESCAVNPKQKGADQQANDIRACVPCSSLDKSSILTREQIETVLNESLPLWTLVVNDNDSVLKLSRKFVAKNFQCALDAMNNFGAIAEQEGHHPDFHLTSYRSVEVVLYTHSVGGITENDVQLAQLFDSKVKVVYNSKWLNEHPEAIPQI